MDPSPLLVFAATCLAVLMLPGQGVTAPIARVLASGTDGVPAVIAGIRPQAGHGLR